MYIYIHGKDGKTQVKVEPVFRDNEIILVLPEYDNFEITPEIWRECRASRNCRFWGANSEYLEIKKWFAFKKSLL